MYDTILLPTDGSEAVAGAIDHAIELAQASDATLHVLYVVDTGAMVAVPEVESRTIQGVLEDAGEQAIADVRERARENDVDLVTVIERGRVHRKIIDYANDHDVDLIVMGTQGRSGLDRVLLGSVADRVIRQAGRPVLVKRSPSEAE